MSRIQRLGLGAHPPKQDINPEPVLDAAWSLVGPGKGTLRESLEELYWEGVENELENIIHTLKVWQQPQFAGVTVPDEDDDFIHGFDTFVDQVSEEAREFANRYDKKQNNKNDEHTPGLPDYAKYSDTLQEAAIDRRAEYISSKIKSSVRETIDDILDLSRDEKRAWMLLQATGFLDIEKLLEHQPQVKKKRAIPQLSLSHFDEKSMPLFQPMHCQRSGCNAIISGSMFTSHNPGEPGVICEDCYWKFYYGKESYSKKYKHCILPTAITPEVSRRICQCEGASGNETAPFPIDKNANHAKVAGNAAMQCDLLKLKDAIAQAKQTGFEQNERAEGGTFSRLLFKFASQRTQSIKSENIPDRQEASKLRNIRLRRSYKNSATLDPHKDFGIPTFLRKCAEKDPFGDIHMALRIGPLIIENGVSHSKNGALISLREMPVFHQRSDRETHTRRLAIAGSSGRNLWEQVCPARSARNYKVVMKQVVGAPFSSLLPRDPEIDIVHEILIASKGHPEKNDISRSTLKRVLEKVKVILQSRVAIYLDSITERLLSSETRIAWDALKNNCNAFCNSLISRRIFEPLVHGPKTLRGLEESEPLYLMSFVCPDEGYVQPVMRTEYDVPSGLTQEYMLRFFFGRNNEADIIDTCQEYWYDWGALGGPLYKYQDIFPWDCTEAYGRYPVCCGDCNLSKHIWAFPYDSWSMVSHHLARDRHMYAPNTLPQDTSATSPYSHLTSEAWMRNRLQVLSASAILCRAAAAMSKTAAFHATTAWLHSSGPESGSRLLALHPSLARVKLGGIHRAQPFSHYFEAGQSDQYFLAEWALFSRAEQIKDYERMRNERMKLTELKHLRASESVGTGLTYFGQRRGRDFRYIIKEDTAISYTDAGFTSHAAGAVPGGVCAVKCGSNCQTGCGSNSACGSSGGEHGGGHSGGHSGCGSSSGGGGSSSSGGGSSSCGGGSSSCGGGSSSSCGGGSSSSCGGGGGG